MYHIDYRPENWNEVVGHDAKVKSLRNELSDLSTCPHVFLFSGPRGTGKTTLAKLVAKELECTEMDISFINCNIYRGVEFMRENIIKRINYKPLYGTKKFYLFDEFHQATKDAQDALLNILEDDCPDFAYFVLCTTEPSKIRETIRSRCASYQLNKLSRLEVRRIVEWVVNSEGLDIEADIVNLVSKEADGIPREALVFLNMVKHCKSVDEASEVIEYSADSPDSDVRRLARALLKNEGWAVVSKIYIELSNTSPEVVRVALCNWFKKVVIGAKSKKDGAWAFFLMDKFISPMISNTAEAELVWALFECCEK